MLFATDLTAKKQILDSKKKNSSQCASENLRKRNSALIFSKVQY